MNNIRISKSGIGLVAYFFVCAILLAVDIYSDKNSDFLTFLRDARDLIVTDIPTNSLSVGLPVVFSVLLAHHMSSRPTSRALRDVTTELNDLRTTIASSPPPQEIMDQLQELNYQLAALVATGKRNTRYERQHTRKLNSRRRRRS